MKRWWALGIVLGYFFLLEMLLAVGRRAHLATGGVYFTTLTADVPFDAVAHVLGLVSTERWAWGCVGPPVLCLAVFLVVPLALVEQREISRKARLGAMLAAGLLVALVVFSEGLAVGEVFGFQASRSWGLVWLGLPLLTWGAWGYGFARRRPRRLALEVLSRQCSLLRWAGLGGLVVGIPAYLLTRNPPGFLSGVGGFLAVFLGTSALLFSGGPRLLFWLARQDRAT